MSELLDAPYVISATQWMYHSLLDTYTLPTVAVGIRQPSDSTVENCLAVIVLRLRKQKNVFPVVRRVGPKAVRGYDGVSRS